MPKKTGTLTSYGVITVLFILFVGLAGCTNRKQFATLPPDLVITQVSQELAGLRSDLGGVAPTLTALVGAVNAQATGLAEQASEVRQLRSEAATLAASHLQSTETAIQATSILPTVTPALESARSTTRPGITTSLSEIAPPVQVFGKGLELPTPTPIAQAEDILFQDDFSSQGGWFVDSNDRFTLTFVDGQYSFDVVTKNSPIWSVKAKEFVDVSLEVDAAQIGGYSDGYYGLVCRHQDNHNYYLLVVSRNGNFGIAKMLDNQLRFLNFAYVYADLLADKGNRLRADCVGNTLTLSVDGTPVLQATDDSFSSGRAGMVVGNRSMAGTNVRFDNFIVLKPTQ